MADPNPAPITDAVDNIEGAQSTSPAQGSGLIHRLLDPSNSSLKRGRVEDVFMDSLCAVVSVLAYRRNVPCLWLEGAMGRWTGAKDVNPPTVGSEVAVWLSADHKYGIIMGYLNAPGDGAEKPQISLFNTPVDRESKNEVHKAKDWGMEGFLIKSEKGIHTDILPGDMVRTNEMGMVTAFLQFVNMMRGDEGSKLETFVLDQLERMTGFNLQIRTSMGERNIMQDFGYTEDEESGSPFFDEAMGEAGVGDLTEIPEGKETLLRRFHDFRGWHGGLEQKFIIRPWFAVGDLTKAPVQPDMGMAQAIRTWAGWTVHRTVTGGGFHKTLQIAVPKRLCEVDDLQGNVTAPDPQPREPFEWSDKPGTPAAVVCQLRDFFAWQFNAKIPQRFVERDKDWVMPDEASCPSPMGGQDFTNPGIGGFYREFPPEQSAMSGGPGIFPGDTLTDGFKGRPGEAWNHVLPDGSISKRDAWGSGIEMRGGHIDITASKDIRLFAGGTVIIMGGDDVIIKGKQSVDITATKRQIRIKAQEEMFIHAEEGGMLISLGKVGHAWQKEKGEKRTLPGICIKVPDKGGFLVDAGQATFNLAYRLYLNRGADGDYPQFLTRSTAHYHWMEDNGPILTKFEDDYLLFHKSDVYSSGRLQVEGDIDAKGHIWSGTGLAGGDPLEATDWSEVPTLKSLMDPSFQEDKWKPYQYPYTLEDLPDVKFVFRTVEDYATGPGKWFETFWQRETPGLGGWDEKPAPDDNSYPYPGEEHYTGTQEFWTYTEQNVSGNGRPVGRKGLLKNAGQFTGQTWAGLKVHPDR